MLYIFLKLIIRFITTNADRFSSRDIDLAIAIQDALKTYRQKQKNTKNNPDLK